WSGTAALSPADDGRVYAGVVAHEVLAPAGELVLRPRTPVDDVEKNEFAIVEGRLRVKGTLNEEKNINIEGGMLSFQTESGDDANIPLWMQRLAGDAGEYNLRIHVGPDNGMGGLRVGTG